MPPLCETSFLASLIQKCLSVTTLKPARQLHALILTTISATSQSPYSPYPYNNVISMYARCGALGDARKVFDGMPRRNLVSFNALISAHSRASNDAAFTFKLLTQMEVECLRPNGYSFTSLLQASSSLEDRVLGSLLHAQVVKFGFLNDVCVQTSLLGMYSNCSDSESAGRIFGWMVDKDVIAWNSMIFGNLKHDKIRKAVHFFDQMLRNCVVPTHFTYSMVLSACGRLGDYYFGKLIHAKIIVSNTLMDLTLQNALLDMYCNCGDIKTAFDIFNVMENPDLVSWNTIIAGYLECGNEDKAMGLFIQLQNISLLKPDEYTFATIITAMNVVPDWGKSLHGQVTKAGLNSSVFVVTALVSMYFKNGETIPAEKVFYTFSEKDIVLWTEMIMGHARMDNGEKAIKCFLEMYQEGYKLDSFVLSGALSACADLATIKQGKMIHSQALKTGFDIEISVGGSLVDMYAKNGDLIAAHSIFTKIPDPDVKCWNSMLGGYSYHGEVDQALKFFSDIQSQGLKPDQVTYLSLLSACNYGGLVGTAKCLWDYMKENGVIPGIKHYSCMVSLLSRAGLLYEAEEMIVKSSLGEDNVELWRTLLSSCVINKNLRVGVHAAEHILRLDSKDGATYILLSNLYAAAGKWNDVAEMRGKVRELMLVKNPGYSWIEGHSKIQAFSSGLQSNSEVNGVQDEVQRLQGNMVVDIDEFNFGVHSMS